MPTAPWRPVVATSTSHQRRIIIAIAIALLGWLVYLNALNNPFVFDDARLVLENPALRDLSQVSGVVWHDISRPLVSFSYALDFRIWGASPLGFHVTNVLLHFVNVLLVFALASAVERDRGRDDRAPGGQALPVTTAALFAVHPMLSQAVGYISARSDLMCTTLVLTAFLCARRFMRGQGSGWLFPAVSAWILSLLSKEVGAMLPLLLVLYDHVVLRPDGAQLKRHWLLLHGPLIAFTAAAGVVRLLVLLRVEYTSAGFDPSLVLVAVDAIRRYALLLVYPTEQTVFHVLPSIDRVFSLQAGVAAGAVALMAAWGLIVRRVEPVMTFGMGWFLLMLVPSSVLFVLGRGEPLAEHRVYSAAIGLFIVFGAAVERIFYRYGSRRMVRTATLLGTAFLVALLGLKTLARNTVWADPRSLWGEAVAREPRHWFPRLMLGDALRAQSGCAAAVPEYQRAVSFRDVEPVSYERLGGCLIELQRWDEAEQAFRALSGLAPASASGPVGLGIVAMVRQGPDASREHLREALKRDAVHVPALRLLATLEEPVRPAEALRLCREIQRLAPATPGNGECIRRIEERIGK